MGRLDGLTGYLEKYEGDAVILNFDEIEALMGSRLPRSARKTGSPFWATHEGNVYAKAWTRAGFVACFDECGPEEVNFTRANSREIAGGSGPAGGESDASERPPPADLSSLPPPPVSIEERAAAVVAEVTSAFTQGSFLLGARGSVPIGWEALPDVIAVRALEAREVDPVWCRLLLAFGASLDRGRGEPRRWRAVSAAFDADVSLFDPEAVCSRELATLADALAVQGLTTRLGEVAGWRMVAEAVIGEPAPSPNLQRAVYEGTADAGELLAELSGPLPAGSRALVPGLASRAAAIRFVRMLVFPGRSSVAGVESLPVVVDANVRRVTEFLGLTNTGGSRLVDAVPLIEALWFAAVASQPPAGPPELAGTALALDQALSFHGRVGCRWCRQKLVLEPIAAACESCKLKG
ncbi:MAG: hypothetical protein HYX32_11450 [Actinobacteria bacterium]|nr:hypothetical protein [Actinomycetota bacterium]